MAQSSSRGKPGGTTAGARLAGQSSGRIQQEATLRGGSVVVICLALAVIGWQSIEVSPSFQRFWNSPLWIIPYFAWQGVFGLLGFHLAQKAGKLPAAEMTRRLLPSAILPLFIVIAATATILGPIATSESYSDYLTSAGFRNYFLNLVGLPQFTLPGVFEFNNAAAIVNKSMWAIPAAALTAMIALLSARLTPRRHAYPALAAGAGLVTLGLLEMFGYLAADETTASALSGAFAGQIGILAYCFGGRYRSHWLIIAVTVVALIAAAVTGSGGSLDQPLWLQIIAIPAVALALLVSSWRWPLKPLGDTFAPYVGCALLIAFPIQQLVSASNVGPVRNLLIAAPLAGFLSALIMSISFKAGEVFLPAVFLPADSVPRGIALRDWRLADLRFLPPGRRRHLTPLLFLFAGLIAVVLAVLAMTLFALQRNPMDH